MYLFSLLVRLDGEEIWFLFYCLVFLATNVVIDCFSLFLNFSTYNLIKDHLLQGSREFESSQ